MTLTQFNHFLKHAIKSNQMDYFNEMGYLRTAVNADAKQYEKFTRIQSYKLKTF